MDNVVSFPSKAPPPAKPPLMGGPLVAYKAGVIATVRALNGGWMIHCVDRFVVGMPFQMQAKEA